MTVRRRGSSISQPVATDIQNEVVIVVLGASGDLAKKKTVSNRSRKWFYPLLFIHMLTSFAL